MPSGYASAETRDNALLSDAYARYGQGTGSESEEGIDADALARHGQGMDALTADGFGGSALAVNGLTGDGLAGAVFGGTALAGGGFGSVGLAGGGFGSAGLAGGDFGSAGLAGDDLSVSGLTGNGPGSMPDVDLDASGTDGSSDGASSGDANEVTVTNSYTSIGPNKDILRKPDTSVVSHLKGKGSSGMAVTGDPRSLARAQPALQAPRLVLGLFHELGPGPCSKSAFFAKNRTKCEGAARADDGWPSASEGMPRLTTLPPGVIRSADFVSP